MNGSSITDTELTYLSSGMSEFESTIIASLPLHAVNCTNRGGISCVFDNGNGSYRVESPMMDCPTSMYDSTIIVQSHGYCIQLNLVGNFWAFTFSCVIVYVCYTYLLLVYAY